MADNVDVARKRRKLPYKTELTLDTARKLLDAGIEEAEKQGLPVVIAIVDAGGNLLAFNRMDNTVLFGIQIAIDKAYTAVLGKKHTGDWGDFYSSGDLIPLFFHERWITFPGGLPLVKNGAVIGGLGVSGAMTEDLYVARAALKAGGFNLDEVDAAISTSEKASNSRKKKE